MKERSHKATTPLAAWLNQSMATWTDSETGKTGISGNKLAELSGVSQTLIWEIQTGEKSQPKADALIRLAEFFDVSPMLLFRLTYLPESESEDFSPEVKAQMVELERILADVPADAQLSFMQSIVNQAEMLQVASREWARQEQIKS